jgi:hypothetical protein
VHLAGSIVSSARGRFFDAQRARHVLALWFPPVGGIMDEPALERARSYAQSCGCRFGYHGSIRAGVFYKPMPARD